MKSGTLLSESDSFYKTTSSLVEAISPTNCYSVSSGHYIALGVSTTLGSVSLSVGGNAAITALKVNVIALSATDSSLKAVSQSAGVSQTVALSKSVTEYDFTDFSSNSSVTPLLTLLAVGKPCRLVSLVMDYAIGTPITATSVSIANDNIRIGIGQYNGVTLSAAFDPSNATYQEVSWSVADPLTASIDAKSGQLFGLKVGSTSVIVTSKVGNLTATKPVTVFDTADNMMTFDNDFSAFGGNAKAADRSGTNYASTASSIDYSQVEAASDTPVLNAKKSEEKILVIPVHVKGEDSNATETVRSNIYKTFFGKPSDTGWESVSSFYYKSSYQQLKIEGEVTEWYDLPYTKAGVANLTGSSSSYNQTWDVLEGAVSWAKKRYNTDLTQFDNDGDGYIDGVWLVYSCDYDATNTDLWWAFTYNDYHLNPAVSSPVASKYCWASYNFMYEGGYSKVDAHTYIHETGHMMGLDDYYTYDSSYGPVGGMDMMDHNIIDHDSFSKFAYGWVNPMVVSGPTEITLNSFVDTGECLLIPTGDSWNGSAFDEYLLVEYYTPTGLNEQDSLTTYAGNGKHSFTESGVRIWHIDSRLCTGHYSNSTGTGAWGSYSYTDKIVYNYQQTGSDLEVDFSWVSHSNTSKRAQMDGQYKLISLVSADNILLTARDATNSSLFQDGDEFSLSKYGPNFFANQTKMNDGTVEPYTISFSGSTAETIDVTVAAA
jgi:M6 family metalloprotease-like protein